MGSRELKGILRVLQDANVASYEKTADGFKVTFRDGGPSAAVPMEALDPSAALDLPEETWDPRESLRKIHQKYVAAEGGRTS